jgi:hypothetical protein
MEFTPEELERIENALAASAVIGGDPEDEALRQKVARLRLVGQKVAFTFEGARMVGHLDRFERALDGTVRAVVIRNGFAYLVDPDDAALGLMC